MKNDTSGSAFPVVDEFDVLTTGMSLRTYIAVKAMAALIAKMPIYDVKVGDGDGLDKYDPVLLEVCRGAWDYADVMLLMKDEKC